MSGVSLIVARGLRVWFEIRHFGLLRAGFVKAVDGVDFEIGKGETVALVGESGCGKSTLARTMLGLNRPFSGALSIDGQTVRAPGRAAAGERPVRAGYVQQDPYGALAPFMDVRRILEEPLLIGRVAGRREREARIAAALAEVRLSPPESFLGKFPHMLSGGQQQRVVIARALIMEPEFIIADEPVSMIDASVRVEIIDLLREIRRARNLTMVVVTHDLSTVRYFARRAFVMYAGRIVEKAPARELAGTPLHPYSRALIEAVPDPDPENALVARALPTGEPPSLLNPPAGCRFHPRCSRAIAGLCEKEQPPEFEPEPGRLVECWLYRS